LPWDPDDHIAASVGGFVSRRAVWIDRELKLGQADWVTLWIQSLHSLSRRLEGLLTDSITRLDARLDDRVLDRRARKRSNAGMRQRIRRDLEGTAGRFLYTV